MHDRNLKHSDEIRLKPDTFDLLLYFPVCVVFLGQLNRQRGSLTSQGGRVL